MTGSSLLTALLDLLPGVVFFAEGFHGDLDVPFPPSDEEGSIEGRRPSPAGDVGLLVGHGGCEEGP